MRWAARLDFVNMHNGNEVGQGSIMGSTFLYYYQGNTKLMIF